jgi:hypothetical protein
MAAREYRTSGEEGLEIEVGGRGLEEEVGLEGGGDGGDEVGGAPDEGCEEGPD